MDRWEKNTMETFHTRPKVWWRYVDDTFTVIKGSHVAEFHDHINNQLQEISFTREIETDEGELSMLDCKVIRQTNGKVMTSIYRKPTHSDRYLDYNSTHPMSVKIGLVRCLADRVRKLTDDPNTRKRELNNLCISLQKNNYPTQFIMKYMKIKQRNNQETTTFESLAFLPYQPRTSENLKRILEKVGVKAVFKPRNYLRDQLGRLKDPVNKFDQSHLVYQIPCADCPTCYIGETSRCLQVRIGEHKRLSQGKLAQTGSYTQLEKQSAIAAHCMDKSHTIDWDKTKVLSKVNNWKERRFAEAMFIITTPNACNRSDSMMLSDSWKILLGVENKIVPMRMSE